MAVIGILLGAAAAVVLGRAAQSLLFGIEAGDPLMMAAAAVCSRPSRSARRTSRPGARRASIR